MLTRVRSVDAGVVARNVEYTSAYQSFGGLRQEGAKTYVEVASWCHAQHALLCCPAETLPIPMFAATSTPPARSTLHAWSARGIVARNAKQYTNAYQPFGGPKEGT